ncbi:transmembrane protein 42, partial [Asparagus officinalis]|uniref:transmembrane protein 42 n=1 Tax=Asparagus officinalis TaxID=4686 RepID=UPI00098E0C6A
QSLKIRRTRSGRLHFIHLRLKPQWRGVPWQILQARLRVAFAAGLNAALAAVSAKFFSSQLLKYNMVIFFNVTMWGCYVNSLKALSSLQATVMNFATNFLSSGLAGYFLFGEPLPSQWFAGAFLIILGVFILSKSTIERKLSSD